MLYHLDEMRAGRRRWIRFAAAWGLLGLVWLVLLPWLGGQERIQRHRQRLDRAGVNAGALYYTDLEMLPLLLQRLNEVHRKQPDALWIPHPRQTQSAEGGEGRTRNIEGRHERP